MQLVMCVKAGPMSNTFPPHVYEAVGKWSCSVCGPKSPPALVLANPHVSQWKWIRCRACGHVDKFTSPLRTVNAARFIPINKPGSVTENESNKLAQPQLPELNKKVKTKA